VPAADPLLAVEDIVMRFGGLAAVDHVSLALDADQLVAIVGPNGAGKTTLFNLLTGQLRPDAGRVLLRGQDITRRRPHERARLGIGRTFQIVRPLGALTVLENAMVGAFGRRRRRGPTIARARTVLERLELDHRADVLASSLTLAERKRLEIARALAGEPEVLLLDEVMAGLNRVETDRAGEIVRGLHAEGLAVVLIEHDLKVVRSLAHRVLVLDHGKTIAHGPPEAVLTEPAVVAAYLGAKHAA
jgi:branched-chain amino acid transport system ATP-binding protein